MGYIWFKYDGFNFSIKKNKNNYTFSSSLPEEYFKVFLEVAHFYEPMKIKTYELEQCPTKAYKLDQCVICLDKKPNILYKPCMHYCICSQCESKEKFENCPYCREIIEESILIKS